MDSITLDQIERSEWQMLSVAMFDAACAGRRMFPSGDLLGRKRTLGAIQKAMEQPLKAIECFRWKRKPLTWFSTKNITTIGDFLVWNASDEEYAQIDEKYIKGIAEAFAASLLLLPHSRLLAKVFGDPPVFIPRSQLEKEDEICRVVEEQLLTLKPARDAAVLALLYGLYSGVGETLEVVGKKCKVSRERVRQMEVRGLRQLRHFTRARELRPLISLEQ